MLVVYAQLSISDVDRSRIDAVRRANDPQYLLVAPHFTFVFPVEDIPIRSLNAHAMAIAVTTPPIEFRLTRATAARDALAPRSHVFLLPAHGERELRELHARLYSGPLAAKLHPTLAYHPHVTIAAFGDHGDAERLAAKLAGVDISGLITTLTIGELESGTLIERHHIHLANIAE